jgi:hypothetical protein
VTYRRLISEQLTRPEACQTEAVELSTTDALFAMLDGQIIRGRKGAWRAEVLTIFTEPDETWVEIGPARRPASSVMVRLGGDQQADRALEALREWTDLPEGRRPGRIDVV